MRRDEPPAVRVYTVCDESRYLIVHNVPSLGCSDELCNLFASYGTVEECKPMDAENCEPFTDVYWIKFSQVNNARFAKRKLDEFVFLGNRLKVSYALEFETLHDAKEKLEGRRREVMGRVKAGRTQPGYSNPSTFNQQWPANKPSVEHGLQSKINSQDFQRSSKALQGVYPLTNHVSSNKEYFASPSMNQSVQLVRNKLDMLQSIGENVAVPAAKKESDNI